MGRFSRVTGKIACVALAVIAAAGLTGKDASATDVNFVSNTNAQVFGAGVFTVASLNFTVSGVREIVVLFNAECSVAASNDVTWLNIDILVDGVLLAPSSSDNAFCTGTGDGALEHWVSAETNGARAVGTSGLTTSHSVVVRGNFGFGSGTWRIDDISLIVIESP